MATTPEPRLAHLFVYGTLRRDAGHPRHALLTAAATFAGYGRIRGELLVVSWYPGLRLDPTAGRVRGELWQLRPDADLVTLDRYEGCAADDPPPHEYRRIVAAVERDDGPPVDAWVYELVAPTDGLPRVAGGDWCDR